MLDEFKLIHRYFTPTHAHQDVILGVGDDAAVIQIPLQHQLVVSMDTLVADVHFFQDDPPETVGHKALAVNLSDMAAMGASPKWISLALTLPKQTKSNWIASFAQGLFALAHEFDVDLIGGDITQGPHLTMTICVKGLVPNDQALTRTGAKSGDDIYVTGSLGAAGFSWKTRHSKNPHPIPEELLARLQKPEPRVLLGQKIRPFASSAIDLSDGLIADLPKLLQQCDAHIDLDKIPTHPQLAPIVTPQIALKLAMCGGDDYELCFTAPPHHRSTIMQQQDTLNIPITCIGQITSGSGKIHDTHNNPISHVDWRPWQHFEEHDEPL